MNVLVAMSGGVDSSVAAAVLRDQGHDVTGVTLKLWGGDSDTGCCSVSDVDDARRVAQQLDIDHLVFNFGDDFMRDVVEPYVADHRVGRTPNPCIECNRHLKFDRLLQRADALGFDAVASGHHARIVEQSGQRNVARGADVGKDQSYVLYTLDQSHLGRLAFPVGAMTKHDVRLEASRLGLRTAHKPDSQDVCFITSTGGRESFLGSRIPLRPGRVVDMDGASVGEVDHIELVTVGQRKGLHAAGAREPRYAVSVDLDAQLVVVGGADDLMCDGVEVDNVVWAAHPVSGAVGVQCSAHGSVRDGELSESDAPGRFVVRWNKPERMVAGGQSVVFYDDDVVLGGGIVV